MGKKRRKGDPEGRSLLSKNLEPLKTTSEKKREKKNWEPPGSGNVKRRMKEGDPLTCRMDTSQNNNDKKRAFHTKSIDMRLWEPLHPQDLGNKEPGLPPRGCAP